MIKKIIFFAKRLRKTIETSSDVISHHLTVFTKVRCAIVGLQARCHPYSFVSNEVPLAFLPLLFIS